MRSMTSRGGPSVLDSKTVRASRDIIMNPTQNLLSALKSCSFSRIRSAIKMPCVDFNHRDADQDSRTPLMRVCGMTDLSATARKDLVKLILGKNMDVNAVDVHGLTALAIACRGGDVGVVRALAEDENVDVNIADQEGNTPLMHACLSEKADVVLAVITSFRRFGLRVDQANQKGVTPLMEAARAGNSEICRVLVQEGRADVNIRDSDSFCTALDFAIESGRCSTPELLLLSPVAQRKHNARQQREAVGFKTLKEVIEVSNMHCKRSEWLKPTKTGIASKYETYPLPTEYAQQANSMVFQVGKRMQRLSEDPEGEMKEEAEIEEEKRRAPIRRRYSLPSARHCVYGSGPNRMHRNAVINQLTASGSPKLARGKGKPQWLKLPSVPETTSLSRSPSPTERHTEESTDIVTPLPSPPRSAPLPQSLPRPVPLSQSPPLRSSPLSQSPPSGRSRSPTRGSLLKTPRILSSNCSLQAHLAAHEPAIASSSYKRPSLRISHSWEGRPSNTVPSYLFR